MKTISVILLSLFCYSSLNAAVIEVTCSQLLAQALEQQRVIGQEQGALKVLKVISDKAKTSGRNDIDLLQANPKLKEKIEENMVSTESQLKLYLEQLNLHCLQHQIRFKLAN